MNEANETEFLSKLAVNIVTELFKKSLVGVKEFGSWVSSKNKKHDPLGIAAKKYVSKLYRRYSYVRIIGMQNPVALRQIFVKVQVLDAISALQILSIKQLEELFFRDDNVADEERLNQLMNRQKSEGSNEVGRIERSRKKIPGIEIVNQENRIFLLGRPGAGKTTFLKSLIISALDGKLSEKLIPIYINLKDWSDSDYDLFSYVNLQFEICDFPNSQLFVENILTKGKCIILFDGLDEALNNNKKIIGQLDSFVDKYLDNKYLISCRIAASHYVFEKFVEIELADFDYEQIEQFIFNWFKGDRKKATTCWNKINEESNVRIMNLASTPLLLTLICINFGNSLTFSSNKAELYKEALDVLLKTWDSSRNIEREEIYKELSLRKKETLLSQIGFKTFESDNLFFHRKLAEKLIQDFITNLNNINSKTLEFDSKLVLNSIEAQHGLLVERAKNIYSFSHLTLQEYFTARYMIDNLAKDNVRSILKTNILNSRWREVFIITSGLLPEADNFLKSMQDAILVRYLSQSLRNFLITSYSLIREDNYFPIEIRRSLALYYALDLSYPRERAKEKNIRLTKIRSNLLAMTNSLATSYSQKEEFSPVLNLSKNIRYDNVRNFADDK